MVEQLVERIRQKDQRAMSQLYQMYIEELSAGSWTNQAAKPSAGREGLRWGPAGTDHELRAAGLYLWFRFHNDSDLVVI